MLSKSQQNTLHFANIVGKLKELKRTGWVRRNVPEPESVAEHSFRLAVLVMVLAREAGVDETKAIKMALIHDLAEAEIGDIVTFKGGQPRNNRVEKLAKERAAMAKILELVSVEPELYDEFAAGRTPEARLVNDVDRLEMAITAKEYQERSGIDTSELIETASALIETKLVRTLLEGLMNEEG